MLINFRRLILGLVCALCFSVTGFAQEVKSSDVISGSGATSPGLFINTILERYQRETGILVKYKPTSSFDGLAELSAGTVDFAVSDLDVSESGISTSDRYVDVPMTVTAIAVIVNLPGVEIVKLTPRLMADIFSGRVNTWDDPTLQAINQRVRLPKLPIRIIIRGDRSGTSQFLTQYLRQSVPAFEWADRSVARVTGNQAMVTQIQQVPGSIGYTEWHYATRAGVQMAALQNKKGYYVTPSMSGIQSSLQDATLASIRGIGIHSDSDYAYPIVGFSWIILPKQQDQFGAYSRAKQLADFVWWATHQGQLYADQYGFPALPEVAMRYATKQLKQLEYDDIILR